MLKKILSFIIIILVVALIALGIFMYLNREQTSGVTGELSNEPSGLFGFLGFGNDADTTSIITTNERDVFVPNQDSSVFINSNNTLTQITTTPVAGATFIGTSTLRYVDRGDGHIYEVNLRSFEIKKVANKTTPQVQIAFWLNQGSSVVYQTLSGQDSVLSSLVTLEKKDESATSSDDTYTTTTIGLENNLTIIPSDTLLYSKNEGINTAVISEAGQRSLIPGTSWLLSGMDINDTLLATNKSHSMLEGFSYSISPTGALDKELGPYLGLTAKSGNNHILFSKTEKTTFKFFIQEQETDLNVELFPASLPEKCVFLNTLDASFICGVPKQIPNTNYPDSWYQGVTSFEDVVLLYNAEALEKVESFPIYQPTVDLDIIEPQLSSDDLFLLFINKKDLTLWLLDLTKAVQSGS